MQLKTRNRLRRALKILSLAIVLNFNACTPVTIAPINIDRSVVIPVRPDLEEGPTDPGVQGTVTERRTIEIPVQDAIKLKQYIQALIYNAKVNVIILQGHIEKLENRLKALAGSSPN